MIELWRELGRPARTRFFLALLLSAAAGAFGVVLLGLSGWFLTAASLAGIAGAGYVFNHLYPSAGVRGAAFGRVLARYAEQVIGHDATLVLSARLRPRLFAAGARTEHGMAPMPAEALSAMIDDVEAAEAGFLRVLSPAAAIAASVAVALGLTFAVDASLGLLAFAAFAAFSLWLPVTAVRRGRAEAAALASELEAERAQSARLVENAVELDILGALDDAARQLEYRLGTGLDRAVRLEARYRNVSLATSASGLVLALLVIWQGVTADVGGLALAVGAALALIAAFDAVAATVGVAEAVNRSALAAGRLTERLKAADVPWNPPREQATEIDSIFPIRAERLVVQAAADAPRTQPIDLDIGRGEVIQVTGRSGSGKTTLAETLMRLHDVAGGTLRYAGIPAGELRVASVLARVAMAPQMAAFLPGTLEAQLRLAAPQASAEQLNEALELACVRDVIQRDHRGLSVEFTEQVQPFSGGELRRIGIARAALADPELLILDEPFAGLDEALAGRLLERLTGWAVAGGRSLMLLVHEPVAVPSCELVSKIVAIAAALPNPASGPPS